MKYHSKCKKFSFKEMQWKYLLQNGGHVSRSHCVKIIPVPAFIHIPVLFLSTNILYEQKTR